jgi:hypothetical protein
MLRTHAKYSPIAQDLVKIFDPERVQMDVQRAVKPARDSEKQGEEQSLY